MRQVALVPRRKAAGSGHDMRPAVAALEGLRVWKAFLQDEVRRSWRALVDVSCGPRHGRREPGRNGTAYSPDTPWQAPQSPESQPFLTRRSRVTQEKVLRRHCPVLGRPNRDGIDLVLFMSAPREYVRQGTSDVTLVGCRANGVGNQSRRQALFVAAAIRMPGGVLLNRSCHGRGVAALIVSREPSLVATVAADPRGERPWWGADTWRHGEALRQGEAGRKASD